MAKVIVMPRLDVSSEKCVFMKWLKEINEFIEVGEPVFEVESDKCTLEVESIYEGYLLEKIAEPNNEYVIGAAVGIIGEKNKKYSKEKLLGKKLLFNNEEG